MYLTTEYNCDGQGTVVCEQVPEYENFSMIYSGYIGINEDVPGNLLRRFRIKITDGVRYSCISPDVFENAARFFYELPTSIVEKIQEEEVYFTDYGTVVIEIRKTRNSIFSIEIGKHSIGYFSEIDNSTICCKDELGTKNENELVDSMRILTGDFVKFISVA